MDEVLVQPTLEMHRTWTVEDLQALDLAEPRRFEIVDGSLVVSPSATPFHELASMDVRTAIQAALTDDLVVLGPVGVGLGRSYLIPDLAVTARAGLRGRKMLQPADVALVVEVVSPGSVSMDRLVKPAKYAAAGIAHFWRVETDPVSLTAYRLSDDVYEEVGVWAGDETVRLAEPFAVELDLATLR